MIEVRLSFSTMAEAANFFHSTNVSGSALIATLAAGSVVSPAPAPALIDVLAPAGTVTPAAGVEVKEKPKAARAKKTPAKEPAVTAPAAGEPDPKSPQDIPKPTI